MRKYKCLECGERFTENDAGTKSELIDHFPGYGNYYEHYYVCPECGSPDLEEVDSIDEEGEEE